MTAETTDPIIEIINGDKQNVGLLRASDAERQCKSRSDSQDDCVIQFISPIGNDLPTKSTGFEDGLGAAR